MSREALLMTLISFLIAIGLSEIFSSLHRLLRIRRKITWSWLPMAWALIFFLDLIRAWFITYGFIDNEINHSLIGFISYIIPTILLLLISFAVLPDSPSEGLNLKDWYAEQKGYFLGLYVVFFLITPVFNLQFFDGELTAVVIIQNMIPGVILAGLMCLAIFSKRHWVNALVAGFWLVEQILAVFSMDINSLG